MQFDTIASPHQTHTSPKGRKFRTISIERIPGATKWMNGSDKSLWRVLIKYIDSGLLLWLYFDYSDKLVSTEKFTIFEE